MDYNVNKYENGSKHLSFYIIILEQALQKLNMRVHCLETELDNFRIKTDRDVNDAHKRIDDTMYHRENRDKFRSSHLSYQLEEGKEIIQ